MSQSPKDTAALGRTCPCFAPRSSPREEGFVSEEWLHFILIGDPSWQKLLWYFHSLECSRCLANGSLSSESELRFFRREGRIGDFTLASFLHKSGLICVATSNQHFLLYTATHVSHTYQSNTNSPAGPITEEVQGIPSRLSGSLRRPSVKISWPLWAPGSGQQRTQPLCLPSGDPQQKAGFLGIEDSLHSLSGGDEKEMTREVAFVVGEGLMLGFE